MVENRVCLPSAFHIASNKQCLNKSLFKLSVVLITEFYLVVYHLSMYIILMFLMFIDSPPPWHEVVKGKHLTVTKFSLNRLMLETIYSSQGNLSKAGASQGKACSG